MASLTVHEDNDKILQIINICPFIDYAEAQQILVGVGGDVEKCINIILNNSVKKKRDLKENSTKNSTKISTNSTVSYYDLQKCNENLKHDLNLSMNDQLELQESLKDIYNQVKIMDIQDKNFKVQFEELRLQLKDILYKHQLLSSTQISQEMEHMNLNKKKSFNYEVLD